MKTLIKLICFVLVLGGFSRGQAINWADDTRSSGHFVGASFRWDYALAGGLHYGHRFERGLPFLVRASLVLPFGEKVLDDYKFRAGGEVDLLQHGDFHLIGGLDLIFRQYENSLLRFQNVGTEVGLDGGYYREKWFVAVSGGWDKAWATRIVHRAYREVLYSDARDGWYSRTAGNLSYGLKGGINWGQSGLSLEIGKLVSDNLKTSPLIPNYLGLSYLYVIK